MSKARFITIEGIEGAGKSTAMGAIADLLEQHGIQVTMTREPGGTPLGESIRALLLDAEQSDMSAYSELLLMFAARAQHLEAIILPALRKGRWVVSDRFTDASFAYQGAGRGLPEEHIAELQQLVQGDLRPDLTLVLDVPPKLGLERARQVNEPDRFERERESFFERVRQCYLRRAAAQPDRYCVVDASASKQQVREQVSETIADLLVHSGGAPE